ncbi:MAG TPA: MFS transporter [Rhodocyclaceae bacterium]|nr:MFS transporter [Rhodocyclaceae bacterium]
MNFAPAGSLWRDRDFMHLFWATTLSVLGTSVTQMALPLTAVQLLHASATQMGILAACSLLPFVLLGLPAGVWIDRSRKRKLAIAFDLFSAAGLVLVPLSYLGGVLCLPVLYLAAAMVSTGEAVGGSAMQVFITQLVGRDRLVLANSQLSGASSAAQLVGPALAAILVALAGAPLAITADALSFVISAILLSRIHRDDMPAINKYANVLGEIKEGLLLVWRTPMLRTLVWVVCVWITLNDSFKALYVLFAARDLSLSAADIALINTLGALGGLLGAAIAHKLERRIGSSKSLVWGVLGAGIGYLSYALPRAGSAYANWMAGAALMLMNLGVAVYLVNYLSLRQAVTPDALLGRMVTTMRFLTIALAPVGTVAIGRAADAYGLVPVFIGIGAGCFLMGIAAWLLLPPHSAPDAQ